MEAALGVVLFLVILRAFRPFPIARRLWWIGSLGYVVFFISVMRPEQSRYAGFLFLLFLSCAWFAVAPPSAEERTAPVSEVHRRFLGTVLILVLAAQVAATVEIYPSSMRQAFSRDEALAQIVHAAHLDNAIVSGEDWDATTVGGYLDRSVYSVARSEWIRYFVHDQREADGFHRITDRAVRCAAETLANRQRHAVAIVTDHPIRGMTLVGRSEDAAIYSVEPSATRAQCT